VSVRTDFSNSNIDSDGFRANVGIILTNKHGKLFWAKRIGMDAWQFPQGGIRPKELTEFAMYRELREETGLLPEHVEIIGHTREWLKYELPERYIRKKSKPLCKGQKQKWYLLKLIGNEEAVNMDLTESPEFDQWKWVNYWDPVSEVISFKRKVYEQALSEFELLMQKSGILGSQMNYSSSSDN
jgi:putative (di)nucleoside polyphosphate hydrolase